MKGITLGLAALLGLVVVAVYSVLKPPPEASGPLQAATVEQAPAAAGPPARTFEIVPEESQARFVIDEVLRGQPKTVVGATNQVAGQVAVNPDNAGNTRVGTILVNARTFATDSAQRDRAVQNFVLQTAEHEYVAFTPTELRGLPARIAVGEPLRFQLVGDLSIRGVTREATFDATVTPESADRLAGSANTTIAYADWGIGIPQVQAVTGVSETVRLELDFVAHSA